MRRIFFAAIVLLLPMSANARDYCQGEFCFQRKARVSCLRPEVWGVLYKVAARVGRLEITSACDGKHARHSYHYSGQAVDFRPMQASPRAALAVLRSLPEVGGIGTYSNGLLHADVRPMRISWFHYRKPRVTRVATAAAQVRYVRYARYARARLAAN